MRHRQILFWLFFISIGASAQSDSAVLVNARWKNSRLQRGVHWKKVQLTDSNYFHSNQLIQLIELRPSAKRIRLRLVHSDSLEPTSQIALRSNALAAVNGSFFKMRGPDPDHPKTADNVIKLERSRLDVNRSVVYFREQHSVIAENLPSKDNQRKRHQAGAIVVNRKQVSILKGDPLDLNWEHSLTGEDVLATGPLMILNGEDQPIPDDAFCNDRHPRTALGKKKDGTLVLLVVDGRAPLSAGLSIRQLQHTLKWLGCTDAINLDGGGSTTMYIKDQPDHGVVNYPSDNSKWDHQGERGVANALLLIKQ
ncbi:phosphodiester glycosidase family protein [Terrimonas sp. NA20]|uniref:Phosphodiester glycosidase family protein n=1 Tax=Terrimonas ginsenosidimutans TaxID=2908004 RepID=A0ABS9KS73_9BACT|nr:phosphodiester glycosidase family protein [Terrimonas ginsenosidimutans]MCG2615161.1 phosphodiester glycosidase family protein [Terrimonas ginsenosidimutans]